MSENKDGDRAAKIARIRALMAKTIENGCTEAEARAAAAAVDRLLTTYELDLDEVTVKEQEILSLVVPNAASHTVVHASAGISAFTDCVCWKTWNGALVYFGFKIDVEVAEYLTHVFRRAIDRESGGWTLFNQGYERARRPKRTRMVESFGMGMAERLAERLSELKSMRDFTRRSAGTDLVAIKKPLVDLAFAKLGLQFLPNQGKHFSIHREAYGGGRAAAEHVAIHHGIAQRVRKSGGILR